MDVGGSHVTAALVDPDAPTEVRSEHDGVVDPHAPLDALLDQLVAPARALAAGTSARGWCVAMPGPFDAAAGRGSFAGVAKFAALAGVDLRAALADRLGVAPRSVRFVNDAVAYGIGEWAAGAGERAAGFVCITLGTGVGSAFLRDGVEVAEGESVPEAGEVHRLTIDGRPLEDTVSTRALRAAYAGRTGRSCSVEELCMLARAGDAVAAEVVATAMLALGRAVGPWVAGFAAERVVVGGSIARSWDVVGPPLQSGFAAGAVSAAGGVNVAGPAGGAVVDGPVVVPAALGARAPLVGASVVWARLDRSA